MIDRWIYSSSLTLSVVLKLSFSGIHLNVLQLHTTETFYIEVLLVSFLPLVYNRC